MAPPASALMCILVPCLIIGATFGAVHRIPLERMSPHSNMTVAIPELKGAGHSSWMSHPPTRIGLGQDRAGGHFFGPVTLGTVPADCVFCTPSNPDNVHTLRLAFDTGSSDLFVFGKDAKEFIPHESDPKTFHHKYFDCEDSDSCRKDEFMTGLRFSLPIEQGLTFVGDMVIDNVQIGPTVLNDVGFAVIDTITSNYNNENEPIPCDGYLGLGFEDISVSGHPPPFIRMVQEGLVDQPLVSFYFHSLDKGEALLGGIDETQYDRRVGLHFVSLDLPADGYARWTIPFDGLQYGSVPRTYYQDSLLLVDTGFSSLFTITTDLRDAIMHKTGAELGSNGKDVVIRCSKRKALEPLKFLIDGREYSFSGEEYFVRYPPSVVEHDRSYYKGKCYLSAYHIGETSEYSSVGVDFMRKYYTVFDYGEQGSSTSRKIGFGVATKQQKKHRKKKQEQNTGFGRMIDG